MAPDSLSIVLGAVLLAWVLRRATGRQPLADALEWPARRLVHAVSRPGAWVAMVAVILYGAALGLVLAALLPGLEVFCSTLLPAPAGAWNTTLNALLMLGAVRVPPARESSPERLAREFATPALLFVALGPWAAYGYRSAAAASAEGLDSPLLISVLRLCDALPALLVRLAARVVRLRSTATGGTDRACTAPATRWLAPLLAVATVAAVVAPLLRSGGFYESSEELAYLHRLWALDESLRAGIGYPRLFPQFAWGFGYPFLNFYAPLSFYLAEVGRLAGCSYPGAMKGLAVGIQAGAAAAMFFFARERCGTVPALVAAASYGTCGYLTIDVYTRGDLAEALCFVWLPLCFWAVTRSGDRWEWRRAAACAIPVALLSLTHNITALLTLPALLLITLVPWRRGPRSPAALVGVLLGLGLAAFFWLPALAEKRFVSTERMIGGNYHFIHHFLLPEALLSLTGEVYRVTDNAISLQGSTPACFLSLIGLTLLCVRDRRYARLEPRVRWMVLLLCGSLLFMLPLSAPVWDAIPLLRYVQFPWRAASLACMSLCYVAAWSLRLLLRYQGRREVPILAAITAAAVLTAYPAAEDLLNGQAHLYHPVALSAVRLACVAVLALCGVWAVWRRSRRGVEVLALVALAISLLLGGWQARLRFQPLSVPPDTFTLDRFHLLERDPAYVGTTARGEYLPRWAPQQAPEAVPGTLSLSVGLAGALRSGSGYRREWSVETPVPATLTYQVFYFPGWQAWVDGRRVPTGASPEGMVTWQVLAGRHQVRADFVDTPVRTLAWWVSGLSLLIVLACSLYPRRPSPADRAPERRPARVTHPPGGESMVVMPLPTTRKPTRS